MLNLCIFWIGRRLGGLFPCFVLFNVPAQAPESCSSLSCDDGPIEDMRVVFFWEELGMSQYEKMMDATSNSILFVPVCLFN